MNTSGLVMQEPKAGADLVDPLAVPDFDEHARKEKSLHDKAIKNMNSWRKEWEQWKGLISLGA